MTITHLKSADWGKFYCLFKTIITTDFAHYPPDVLAFLINEKRQKNFYEQKYRQYRVACHQNEIIGFIITRSSGGVSRINWLGVSPEYRGQGFGRQLVKAWEKWSLTHEIHKLHVSTTNPKNISFYQKLGFELEGILKKDTYQLDRYLLGKVL